ncbi:MAG TPA: hypothetical protein VHA52_02850, partial [Candidatus Babeliaceae bacterium]|nr:hypothetical protein [Candidatus Babeliaceae bacterium]
DEYLENNDLIEYTPPDYEVYNREGKMLPIAHNIEILTVWDNHIVLRELVKKGKKEKVLLTFVNFSSRKIDFQKHFKYVNVNHDILYTDEGVFSEDDIKKEKRH